MKFYSLMLGLRNYPTRRPVACSTTFSSGNPFSRTRKSFVRRTRRTNVPTATSR